MRKAGKDRGFGHRDHDVPFGVGQQVDRYGDGQMPAAIRVLQREGLAGVAQEVTPPLTRERRVFQHLAEDLGIRMADDAAIFAEQ